jgi:hypothetical protein
MVQHNIHPNPPMCGFELEKSHENGKAHVEIKSDGK